jgi:mono/diheme cytochrome c family protein
MSKSVRYFSLLLATLVGVLSPNCAEAADVAEGRSLYLRYCSSCHGTAADGRGPVSVTLKTAPPDLTQLGARYGTPLPAGQIARFIDGRSMLPAHGAREMPVWGQRFSEIYTAKGSSAGDMDVRIRKIIDYLNSIQRSAAPAETPRAPLGRHDPGATR